MSCSSVPLRRAAVAAALALSAVGAAAYPAAAGAGSHLATTPRTPRATASTAVAAVARPTTGVEGVELQLTPRDRAGLAALAGASGLSRATRLTRLAPLLPGVARAASVAATLRRDGLTVTSTGELTVTATGPAATVDALFGTATDPALPTAQALPRIPASLSSLVTAAYGGDDTRPAEEPLGLAQPSGTSDGTLSVAQARSLYGTTATTAEPSSTAPIVATLQFTSSSVVSTAIDNASTYASDNALYADSSYDASSNITPVAVQDPGCSAAAQADDGVEVGLDQETLLTVAPQLRQRVYTAPNCGNTQDIALAQVVSDVQAGMPIVALSTSWGTCEAAQYSGTSTRADVDAVNSLLAAGVTMFAASGDDGSNDCRVSPARDAIDTPAAIPGVVAVGGTKGTSVGALQVWNDGHGASGGGYSCGYFARPAYQRGVAHAATYPHDTARSGFPACKAGTSVRMVPDIAEDAGDGLDVVVTDRGQTGPAAILGTSFAAPLAAGGFAETLDQLGVTTVGLGDIHTDLYSSSQINDVTAGSNGDYKATAGYDVASGLGSPMWPAVLTSTRDLSDISVASDGTVQLTRALADAEYHAATSTESTALHVGDAGQWRFLLAPYGGDRASDLWAVRLTGDGSGHVVVYVFSQRSGYTRELQARVTPVAAVSSPSDWDAQVSSYDVDRASDLFLLHEQHTSSGHVELFAVSQASSFHTFVAARITAGVAAAGDHYFVGDVRGDLFGVSTVGSGHVTVTGIAESGSYHGAGSVVSSPYAQVASDDGSVQFAMTDVTGDGYPDLEELLLSDTGSGQVELHAVAGPAFTTVVIARITALPDTLSTSDTWTVG